MSTELSLVRAKRNWVNDIYFLKNIYSVTINNFFINAFGCIIKTDTVALCNLCLHLTWTWLTNITKFCTQILQKILHTLYTENPKKIL